MNSSRSTIQSTRRSRSEVTAGSFVEPIQLWFAMRLVEADGLFALFAP